MPLLRPHRHKPDYDRVQWWGVPIGTMPIEAQGQRCKLLVPCLFWGAALRRGPLEEE